MNTVKHSNQAHPLLILLLALLIGLTGCATSVQKTTDIDKEELAMRLQNCILFISTSLEQAKSSDAPEAQNMLNEAQHLSLNAKDDYTHEKYQDALNKVNEAYRLGLKALTVLKKETSPTIEEQQQQLQQRAETRLHVNETYVNAVKRTFGYITTEAAKVAFDVALKNREKALNDYAAKRYQEAILNANKSTDNLILILTELEYIEHNKDKRNAMQIN